jgi:hypothetical protein
MKGAACQYRKTLPPGRLITGLRTNRRGTVL